MGDTICGFADLNKRDFDHRRAQLRKLAKDCSLVPGASDKNSGSGEGMFFVGLALEAVARSQSSVLGLFFNATAQALHTNRRSFASLRMTEFEERMFHGCCGSAKPSP